MGLFLTVIFIFIFIWLIYASIDSKTKQKPLFTTTVTYSNDPSSNIFDPTHETREILKAFLFLAKADGAIREAELKVMINFLVRQQSEHSNSAEWYLMDRIKELQPYTEAEYMQFVEFLDLSSKKNLLTWLKNILNTQKSNHPYEERLLNDLQRSIANS